MKKLTKVFDTLSKLRNASPRIYTSEKEVFIERLWYNVKAKFKDQYYIIRTGNKTLELATITDVKFYFKKGDNIMVYMKTPLNKVIKMKMTKKSAENLAYIHVKQDVVKYLQQKAEGLC